MYEEFISFLKRHDIYDEDIYNSYISDAFIFPYRDDNVDLINCFYAIDKNDVLVDIKVSVPYIDDEKTILINIHEYVHYYIMYKKLGKKVIIGQNCEVLPLLYEKLYILENDNIFLRKYEEYLLDIIIKNDDKKYLYGLEIRDKILNSKIKTKKITNNFI